MGLDERQWRSPPHTPGNSKISCFESRRNLGIQFGEGSSNSSHCVPASVLVKLNLG